MTNHRNRLFDRKLGITPKSTLTIDGLHAWFWGVLLITCRVIFWALLIQEHSWGDFGTIDETIATGTIVVNMDLQAFYKRRHRELPLEGLTKVGHFWNLKLPKDGSL